MKKMTWLLVLLMGFSLFAQEEKAVQDITDISLDDLLNTVVSVAGKTGQKISEAPAIISVITSQDIREMGALNLNEVLSYIPGVNITETYYGFTSAEFRGNLQAHYNNKSLLLINDHPLYDSTYGTYILENIPINAVERIEVIRGPGSTLYGTNAFAGVIKIVTKTASSFKNAEIGMLAGSETTLFPSVNLGYEGKDLNLSLYLSSMNSKGYDYQVKRDEDGLSGNFPYENDYINAMASMKYKSLTANFGYFTNDKDKFGVVPTLVSTGKQNRLGWFADINWRWQAAEKVNISATFYYDRLEAEEAVGWFPPNNLYKLLNIGGSMTNSIGGSKYGLDLSTTLTIQENNHLSAGFLYESQQIDPILNRYDQSGVELVMAAEHDSYDLAGFIQYDTRLFEKLGAVVGVRLNHNKEYGTNVTPRAGLVYSLSERASLKFLYGRAYRNPNMFEKYASLANVLFGDPKLNPEKIMTFDLGLDWMFASENNLRMNVFYFSTNDLITRNKLVAAGALGNSVPTPQYGNSDGQEMIGLEMELKGRLAKKITYFANLSSILQASERADDSDVPFVPMMLGNIGLGYQTGSLTISPYLQYVGKKSGELATGVPTEVPAYTLLNVNLSYKVCEFFSLQLIAKNVTDTAYVYPEYIRRVLTEIPGGPGFQIFLKGIFSI